MKVLILDDEKFDLFVVKKLVGLEFEAEGFTVPQEALDWARANTFDVVIIDYYLTTTVQAHHVLQQLHTFVTHPFRAFVLTNYVDSQQVTELKAARFDAVIHKPFTLEYFKVQLGLS